MAERPVKGNGQMQDLRAKPVEMRPRLAIFGIGGGGGNAMNLASGGDTLKVADAARKCRL